MLGARPSNTVQIRPMMRQGTTQIRPNFLQAQPLGIQGLQQGNQVQTQQRLPVIQSVTSMASLPSTAQV